MRSPPRPARTVALGAWIATLLGVGGFSWMLFACVLQEEVWRRNR